MASMGGSRQAIAGLAMVVMSVILRGTKDAVAVMRLMVALRGQVAGADA